MKVDVDQVKAIAGDRYTLILDFLYELENAKLCKSKMVKKSGNTYIRQWY